VRGFIGVGGGGTTGSAASEGNSPAGFAVSSTTGPSAVLADPVGVQVVSGGSAAKVAAGVVDALFASSPVVVVSSADPGAQVACRRLLTLVRTVRSTTRL